MHNPAIVTMCSQAQELSQIAKRDYFAGLTALHNTSKAMVALAKQMKINKKGRKWPNMHFTKLRREWQ